MRVFKSSPRLATLVGRTVAVRTVGLDTRDYTLIKVEAVDYRNGDIGATVDGQSVAYNKGDVLRVF